MASADAAAVTAAPVYALRRVMTPMLGSASTVDLTTGATLVLLLACGVVGVVVYANMLALLKVDEARFIWQRLSGRLRSRA